MECIDKTVKVYQSYDQKGYISAVDFATNTNCALKQPCEIKDGKKNQKFENNSAGCATTTNTSSDKY